MRRNRPADHVLRVLSLGGISMPTFWLALVCLYVFFFRLNWVPGGGRLDPGGDPSLLVRHGKGGKPRRQPLPPGLADELRRLRAEREPRQDDPVLCGLAGGRLQHTTLAAIIHRAAARAGLEKRVTAHTLRHTAATWLRQELGDARLVAEYLGHADLSTVSRYAHVARNELFSAADRLEPLATSS